MTKRRGKRTFASRTSSHRVRWWRRFSSCPEASRRSLSPSPPNTAKPERVLATILSVVARWREREREREERERKMWCREADVAFECCFCGYQIKATPKRQLSTSVLPLPSYPYENFETTRRFLFVNSRNCNLVIHGYITVTNYPFCNSPLVLLPFAKPEIVINNCMNSKWVFALYTFVRCLALALLFFVVFFASIYSVELHIEL